MGMFKGRLAGLSGWGMAGQTVHCTLCKCHCPQRTQRPQGLERKHIFDQGFRELCGQP